MNDIIKIDPSVCVLSDVGAVFNEDATLPQWKDTGKGLCRVHHAVNWCLGDWILFGVKKYGDIAKNANDLSIISGLNEGTLYEYALTSKLVPHPIRVGTLSYSHHLVIRKLDSKDQSKWLAKAVENKWSVGDLRAAIRSNQAEFKEPTLRGVFVPTAWLTEGLRGFKRCDISKWDEQQRRQVLAECDRFIEQVYRPLKESLT